MAKDDEKLPYHADIVLFEKMLGDLKTSGSDGVNLDTLWANIGAAQHKLRSYTLGLGKFVGLMDSDNKKAWLTDLGTTLRYMSKDERGKTLSTKMPEKYLTMFKWILDEKEVRSNELKRKFIETWGSVISASVLDRAITTFLNYCDWLGIIKYQGRGNQAKAIITEFGKRVLELSTVETTSEPPPENNGNQPSPQLENQKSDLPLPKDAVFPVIIKTRDRYFDYDMKTELDLKIIDTVIASIKDDWAVSQKKQPAKEGDDK